jgi:hypothetical protein
MSFLSGVHFFTDSRCKSRPNTEGANPISRLPKSKFRGLQGVLKHYAAAVLVRKKGEFDDPVSDRLPAKVEEYANKYYMHSEFEGGVVKNKYNVLNRVAAPSTGAGEGTSTGTGAGACADACADAGAGAGAGAGADSDSVAGARADASAATWYNGGGTGTLTRKVHSLGERGGGGGGGRLVKGGAGNKRGTAGKSVVIEKGQGTATIKQGKQAATAIAAAEEGVASSTTAAGGLASRRAGTSVSGGGAAAVSAGSRRMVKFPSLATKSQGVGRRSNGSGESAAKVHKRDSNSRSSIGDKVKRSTVLLDDPP